jgi:hypothetical protein
VRGQLPPAHDPARSTPYVLMTAAGNSSARASAASDTATVRAASATSTGRPRPVSAADREAFDALAKESLSAIRSMAAAWRTGLTALITLVTTGIILKGRTDTTNLTLLWRIGITLAVGAGLALAILGLWHALAAEVGARTRLQTLDKILARYASVQAYQVGQAAAAGRRLQSARILVAAALGLLLTGVLLTWWAPAAPAKPAAYLEVTRPGGTVCGILRSADGGTLRLTVVGAYEPVTIPLATITNLAVTPTCP